MKPATKVFATLSLSAAVGSKIKQIGKTEDVRGAGTALEIAGIEAAGKYPASPLSQGKIEDIVTAVKALLSEHMEPQEIVSMLLAGLTDIWSKCNPERHILLDPIIYSAQACLDFLPEAPDHEAAFERYERWCNN